MSSNRSSAGEARNASSAQNRTRFIILMIVAAVVVLGAVGYGVYYRWVSPLAAPSYIVKVQRSSLVSGVTVAGNVVTGRQARLTFGIPGQVAHVMVGPGQTVKAGDTLATLETNNLKIALEQARSNLRIVELRRNKVKESTPPEQREVALAAISAANAIVAGQPRPTGVPSGDLESAKETEAKSSATLALLRNPAAIDLAIAEEEVHLAQLQVNEQEAALEGATIKAPWDGVVAAISANVGEQAASTSTFVTVVDPRAVRVAATITGEDVRQLGANRNAEVTIDAFADRRFQGQGTIVPLVAQQNAVPTFQLLIDLDPGDVAIPAGMNATVDVIAQRKNDVLVVPKQAVQRQGTEYFVHVPLNGGVELRKITVGLSNSRSVEIVEGLAEGDTVLVSSGGSAAQPAAK